MKKEKRILIDIVLHCGSLTEHVRNNQIVLYVENPRTLLFQFLVKYTRNEVITLPCRGTQELTPPIQWYSGTHLSDPHDFPHPSPYSSSL